MITVEEAKLLERIINQHCEGRVQFNNFKDQILPQTDEDLRARLASRISHAPLDVIADREFFNLIATELANSLQVVQSFQELRQRYDQDPFEMFKLIDEVNFGYIDLVNLGRFLRKNSKYLSDREIEGILQRMGHNHTGKVTQSEFVHSMTSLQGSQIQGQQIITSTPVDLQTTQTSPSKLNKSVAFNDELFQASRRLESAQKEYENTLNRSFSRSTSRNFPSVNFNNQFSTPTRTATKSMSFIDSGQNGYRSATKTSMRLPYPEAYSYAQVLAEVIRRDNIVEEQKVRLAACSDFNLYDAFATFVRFNRSYIDIADLQTGLDKLGVYKPQAEVEIIARRFSAGNSAISLNQFGNMLLPNDRQHRDRARHRSSNPGSQVSVYTNSCLAKLLSSMIDTECEQVKQKDALRHRIGWSNSQSWSSLNPLGLPKITQEDFRVFLNEHRIVAMHEELDRLMIRFGSNEVQQPEFVAEVETKFR